MITAPHSASQIKTRRLFLESLENFKGPKSQLSNCNHLFWKVDLLTCFYVRKTKRIVKFDGLETRSFKDIRGSVATEIDPKSFATFEKQVPDPKLPTVNILLLSDTHKIFTTPVKRWPTLLSFCSSPFLLASSMEDNELRHSTVKIFFMRGTRSATTRTHKEIRSTSSSVIT